MSEEIEKVEEVVETTEPKTEEVVSTWKVVDETPEVHPSFLEQPKVEEVLEKVVDEPKTEEKTTEEKVDEKVAVVTKEIHHIDNTITIVKNNTDEKIDNVDNFGLNELELFFADRYK